MLKNVMYFASAEAGEKSDLLGSLGIDVRLLIFQCIAFLVLLFLLSKYAFPVLAKMIEDREKTINSSIKAAHEAEKNAEKTQGKVASLLKEARKQADDIIVNAKVEASKIVENADKKSIERAERMIGDAEAQITRNVADAKKALRNETIELVASATEIVVGKTVNDSLDKRIIKSAVEEVEA